MSDVTKWKGTGLVKTDPEIQAIWRRVNQIHELHNAMIVRAGIWAKENLQRAVNAQAPTPMPKLQLKTAEATKAS